MLKTYLETSKQSIEQWLSTVLHSPIPEYKRLYEAMNYSLLQGGKRIRPILTKAVLDAMKVDASLYKEFLCALECIHTYSLIHDDLPAMDNDDYRRGNLTNHKVYGDGMAILAGDGLLTYAFQLCSENTTASAEQKIKAIQCLATAAGPEGMVGGQAFDLLSEGKHIPLEELKILHSGKTGALFNAAIELGLILSNADQAKYAAYMTYANCLGLLFQITDDILDVTGTIEELGKTPGSDIRQDKSTYVSLLGLDEARNEAHAVAQKAHAALATIEDDTHILSAIIDYLMDRTH
ncbi:polyprenyl synthetase family protein [Veillonella atypica]|uniref:polyprenyl synthetase family protein n=1 Tax=Veillonella atypica TaxID=39777 RepID=UPI0009E14046|nr:farnesyl diphosphate synthase [Veillonella atypica]ARF99262.1 farnesyl-diphosphate synthase [Veillonella atypica]MBF1740520.1 polyprenyl synthetase family protein [Veillonella sp.]MCB6769653.1 polyprenyl synthetase family protein [Veillonella atypica]